MANSQSKVTVQVGFNVDKSGLSEMQSLFQQIAFKAAEPGNKMNTGLQQAAKTATTLDNILSKTFNTDLGTLNVTKFNQELAKSGINLKQVKTEFSQIGSQGVNAYNKLAQAILGTNQQIAQSNKALDKMFLSIKNVFTYNISSSIFNRLTDSIGQAYSYVKNLDKSLNDIRIVTDKSADDMERFAENANTAAKNLGANTLDYTNASLIYYQQGLSDEEVAARAETTIKAANVTGQTGEEVSEQLTAVWNGYKVTAEETESYIDKLAAVAATTAADLEELSTGMSKVASAANAMGVDFDDLNAQIATIVSVTRQAPESVGTALKTIYARLGDLKVDGVDEFGVSLGEVSSQLQQMGIQVLDQQGNLRNMTDVIAEVAMKWNGWTEAQRQAAAVAMAGKRQYNNLIALFDNWDMYTDALITSQDALGTLQKQQDVYMESTEAKLKTLKATWQDLYDDLINEDELNTGIELLTDFVQVFDNLIASFGGGIKTIAGFATILSSVFNKQIVENINAASQRIQVFKQNLELAQTSNLIRQQDAAKSGDNAQEQAIAANTQKQIEYSQKIYDARLGLNQEQAKTLIGYQQELGSLEEQIVLLEKQIEEKQSEAIINDNIKNDLNEIDSLYGQQLDGVKQVNSELIENANNIKGALTGNAADLLTFFDDINNILVQIGSNEAYDAVTSEKWYQQLQNIANENTDVETKIKNHNQEIALILKEVLKYSKEVVQVQEKQNKAAEEYVNLVRQQREKQEHQANIKQQADAMLELGNNATTTAQKVTTVTSALGNMAMAWSSINSLMETWSNDDIDFGDKITQTVMTLGMTIPMLISSFTQLSTVTAASNAITQKSIILRGQEAIVNMGSSKTRQTMVKNVIEDTVAQLANNKAIEEELVVRTLEEAAKKRNYVLSEKEKNIILLSAKAKLAESGANVTEAGTTDLLTASKTKLLVVSKKLIATIMANPWLAALTAGVAIIAGVVKAYDNYIEKIKEENEETLKEAKEKENIIKTNQELYESYINIYGQFKKGENVQDSLYDTTLKLADAYDIQGAKILALSDRYDILTNKIEEARKAELDTLISEADKGATGAGENAIIAGRGKGLGGFFFDRGRLSGNVYTYQDSSSLGNENQQGAIQAAGLEKNYNALTGKLTKRIDYSNPEQVKAWMDEVDKMVEYYQNNVDEIVRDSDSFYNSLVTEQRELTENGQELIAQLSLKYSGMIEKAILDNEKIKLNEQTTASELLALKEELKNSLGIPEEEFEEGFKNYLKNIDSIEDAYTKLEIAEQINEKMNEGAEEGLQGILEQIQDFNNAELAFLEAHLNTAILDQDLEKWKEKNKDVLDALGAQETASSFKDVLSNYNEKDGVTPEQQAAIYNNEGMSSYMPSESSFGEMDEGDKLNAITQAWIESTKAAVEYKDEAIKALKDQQKEVKNQLQLEQQSALMNEQIIDKKIEGNEKLEDKLYNIIEVLKKLSSEGYGELNDEEKQLLKNVKNENILTEKQIKEYGETAKKVDDLSDAYEDYENEIKRIDNLSEDHATNVNALKQVMQKQSGIIDDIQSAYKSLIGVVDEYNESGSFTIDMVQQLMTMDDSYVATLQFENGQLSLNEQAFQALTIAKIDDMEQTAVLTAQEELEKLAEEGVADASLSATSAILNAAAAARDASEAAKEGAAAWDEYAASMRAAAGVSGTQYDAKAKQITDALQNRLLAAENAKSQIRRGGSSMRKAMGGGSGSKSSGGSKGKDKEDKELKNLDEEFDRYWQLKKAIDATDKAVQKLEKDQENLHGKELIQSLQNENELLETQKGNYEALLAAQNERAAALRAELGTMGVVFDASGAIVNYAEATANALAAYNAAIQQYNAGLIDETTLGVYEKSFENFKKLLEEYDKLYYTEIQETQDRIDEAVRKQKENNLKAWEEKIKIKIDWQDLKKGWRNFRKEMEEDFTKIFPDLRINSKTSKKNAKNDKRKIGYDIDAIKEVNAEIDKMMAGGESSMFESVSQAQEKLKELNQDLQNHAKELKEDYKEAWDNYLEGIDQVSEKLEQIQEQYENINSELEFQKQLIELLYGEDAYDLNASLYEGQITANSNRLNSLVAERDTWKQLFEESGASMDNMEKWSVDQMKYYQKWQEAQKNLNDLTLEQIQLLQDQYMNTVRKVITELEKGMNNGQRLEDVRTNWERIQQSTDGVYDNVQRLYQVQTLMNKYDTSIADTKDLAVQQKLNKVKEQELEYLRDKKELTEYDIQAANLRYELALRQIALEEAQNNKTSMKLTRNEQGNWSYQYVADEEDVAGKQQNVLDTWNQLYELADEAHNKNIESMMSLNETYLEQLQEIYELSLTDKELADQRKLELDQWYQEQRQVIIDRDTQYEQDQLTATAGLLQTLYDQDSTAFGEKTEKEQELAKQLSENVGTTYGDLTQAIKDNYDDIGTKANEVVTETNEEWKSSADEILNTWVKDPDSVKKMITKAYSDLEAANQKYQKAVDTLAKQVGRDFGESGIKGAIDKAAKSTENLDDKTRELCENGKHDVDKLKDSVDKLKEAWDSVKDSINDAISAIEEYLKKQGEANSQQGQSGSPGTGGNASASNSNNGSSGNGSGSGGGSSSTSTTKQKNHGVYNSAPGAGNATVYWTDSLEDAKRYAEQANKKGKSSNFKYFKSGGYTGEWGEDGRLALLHQKELVLNKDDTENFLSGISMIRDMASLNGSIEKSILQSIANMAVHVSGIKPSLIQTNDNNSQSNNTFNITAEFPNANNVDEIRQAILTLPNIASQYINANKR